MMNMVLRNFFFAVGIVMLAALDGMNPAEAQFGDLVRLVQSEAAQKMVVVVMLALLAVDWIFGYRVVSSRSTSMQSASASAAAGERARLAEVKQSSI
jgi:hypothetical protein